MPAAVGRIREGLQQILERGRTEPGLGHRRRRGHPQLRRTAAGGAHRRRRPAAAHRALAQRAGVARLPPLPAAAHPAAAGARARRRGRAGRSGRPGRRGADAGLHPHAPGDAGAGPPLPAQPRRGAAPRSPAAGRGDGRGRRAAARLGRRGRHRLCDRHRARWPARWASRASCPTAWTRRRTATSRSASCTRRRWRWCTSAGWPRT